MNDPVGATALEERVQHVRGRIRAAAQRAGRDPAEVRLIGASKLQSLEKMREAAAAGLEDFGENYLQELSEKRTAGVGGATWHFIGSLQSGTANRVADVADWVHSLTPGRAGERLARRAASQGKSLPVLIEVDFTGGEHTGVDPEGLEAFADLASGLSGLSLRGLMTVPPVPNATEDPRRWFAALRELGERVQDQHPELVELSMGMSGDYEVAVEEGATMVRVGAALFGQRPVSGSK